MKVFMIGGTGLLGSRAAKELIDRGHSVRTLSLPGVPQGAHLPEEMGIFFGNFHELSDDRLRDMMAGCDAFVFAAGVDERIEGPKPIYDMFYQHNNLPLARLLPIAKELGVKHAVVLGSYFSFFAKIWPEYDMEKNHPYIQSRLDQEALALSFADENFDVAVLQLPYIFGTQPGRKPVWVFLVDNLRRMPGRTFYPDGGTTMVTVNQVGQAIAGALEKNRGPMAYPIGWYNLTWRDMLTAFHLAMGMPDRKITTIPTWLFQATMVRRNKHLEKKGLQGGLDMVRFAPLMARKMFIDKELGSQRLGVQEDDIVRAITDSVKLSLDVLDGRDSLIEMTAD